MSQPVGPLQRGFFLLAWRKAFLQPLPKQLFFYRSYLDENCITCVQNCEICWILNVLSDSHPYIEFTLDRWADGKMSLRDVLLRRWADELVAWKIILEKISMKDTANWISQRSSHSQDRNIDPFSLANIQRICINVIGDGGLKDLYNLSCEIGLHYALSREKHRRQSEWAWHYERIP